MRPTHAVKALVFWTTILTSTVGVLATSPLAHWTFDEGSGTSVGDTAGGHDGTVYGAAWSEGITGGGLNFDGVNDYVEIPSTFPSDVFTVAGWLRMGAQGGIFSSAPASFSVYLTPDGSQLRFRIDTRIAGGDTEWIGVDLPDSGWHPFAASFDGTTMRLYLDGYLESSMQVANGDLNEPDSTYLGSLYPGLGAFSGSLDDLRYYDVALSDQEILDLTNPENDSAPRVDAGPDLNVTVETELQLGGLVSDDGLPNPPGTVTTLWTLQSGPTAPVFSDTSAVATGVTFTAAGTYVLRLTADDSALVGFDDVTVTVAPSLPPTSLGRVEAEDFKAGGEGVGYHDTTATDYGGTNYRPGEAVDIYASPVGYFVGSFRIGEWLAFDVDVSETRSYDVLLRLMSNVAITRQLSILVDGVDVTGPLDIEVENSLVWFDFTYADLQLTQGRHEIQIRAETNSLNLDYFEITAGGGNLPPVVDAGPNTAITLPSSVTLQAAVSDDGQVYPSPTLTWSTFSGPGRVMYDSPHAAQTLASFAVEGVYVLRLTAFDGEDFGSDTVTVTVAASPTNQPPTAFDQSVSVTQDVVKQIDLDYEDTGGPGPYTFTYGTPGHGTVDGTGASVVFTPDNGYTGPDSFVWSVSDGEYESSATVSISVNPPRSGGAIVVDHSDLEAFDRIPDAILAAARNLNVIFSDRSVGVNLDEALDCFASSSWDTAPNACKRDYASIDEARGRYTLGGDIASDPLLSFEVDSTKYNRSHWIFEDFYAVWYRMVQDFTATFAPSRLPSNSIVTFQFSYLNNDPSIVDPACGFFATQNRESCPGYLQDADVGRLSALEAAYPDNQFVYWTTSLARNGDPVLNEFNDEMRQYAIEHGKILFDFADIEAHNPDGTSCFDSADGVPYYLDGTLEESLPDDGISRPAICRRYTTETTGGHLGSVSGGKVQVARGFWILMSCIAGWSDPVCGP